MKKLLLQFDTDTHSATFDTVVAYDSGVDHVITHAGLTADNIYSLVEGAIFTRSLANKKNTAIFVGGSDIAAGHALFLAVQKRFFAEFRVSVMLDSNGSNTTAAATVAKIATSTSISGKKVVVLGGTGPVGQRAAAMFAQEGAEVSITSRHIFSAEETCFNVKKRFGVNVTPVEATDSKARGHAIKDANIVFAAGAAGIELLKSEYWQNNSNLEVMADANASLPLGIEGIDRLDRGTKRHGKLVWGAIGFGALKLALHRACIKQLFEDNKQVLDAELIFKLAKKMA